MATATRRRRSRYTVTFEDGTREVVLSYGVERAGVFAAEHYGKPVAHVRSGDYKHEERVRERVGAHASNGFNVDYAMVERAKQHLDIRLEVRIVQTSVWGGRDAAHSFRPRYGEFRRNKRDPEGSRAGKYDTAKGGMVHHITVKGWLSAEEAGRAIWHELAHAAQAEAVCRAAGAWQPRPMYNAWREAEVRDHGTTYMDKRHEVDARAHERLNDTMPLAVAR